MKHKFSKILLSMLMLGGVLGLASCEKASHTATIPTEQCEVRIIEDKSSHDKSALVTLGIKNDTIYNTTKALLTYDVYKDDSIIAQGLTAEVNVYVRHGVAGYLTYSVQVDKTLDANFVKITKAEVTGYMSLWETYQVSFITMITIVSIALIFFAVELFRGGLTREGAKEVLRERLASTALVACLVLIICLIPLMFSNWVTTLILVGGFVGATLLAGLLTLIRMAFIKE